MQLLGKEPLMEYDFDTVVDRRGTDSVKWDCYPRFGHTSDDLPLWVADMDFALPPEVIADLRARCDHGIFGYTQPSALYYQAVCSWIERHEGWRPEPEFFVHTPGVVFALAASVRAFTDPGDGVLIQRPVYYPFTSVVEKNGRRVVNAPLVCRKGRYSVDFDAFEQVVARERPRMFLLCNPHNPVGRVWTLEELSRISQVCSAYQVQVVSDEIHADFARPGHTHVPFVRAGGEAARTCVVCTSPGKSFNLAGLQVSNILVQDEEVRERLSWAVGATGFGGCTTLGYTACRSCYEKGGPWFSELLGVIDGNIRHMGDYLRKYLPKLHLIESESTYLTWVDCRELGLSDEQLDEFISKRAHLWLDPGHLFGPEGSGFMRFNVACPRATLDQALSRLRAACEELT